MKKIKKIRRFAPCAICDIERLESWLTDMAAQGWHLKEVWLRLRLFIFEKGEPNAVRYRLEAGKRWEDDEMPESTVQALFQDCGWESVGSYSRFFIFRTQDANAPELNTDPAVHLLSIQWLRRKVITESIVNFCVVVMMLVALGFSGFQYIAANGVWIMAVCLAVMMVTVIDNVMAIVQTNRYVKQLKTNEPLDHNKPWREKALYHQISGAIGAVVGVLFYGMWLGSVLVSCGNLLTNTETEAMPYPGDPPIVTVADMAESSGYTVEEMESVPSWSETTNSGAYTLDWMEGCALVTPEGETVHGYIWVIYHETSAEWIAEGLAKEYLRAAQREKYYEERELPELTVDFAAAYGSDVILQEGNVVIKARIPLNDGDDSLLLLWIEKTLELLKG